MSRWGKNIVVPLDSLCKEKENTNRPTVARSVGTVGKWGKMGFTSTRTYALPAAAAASLSPASAFDDEMSPSVPEPPKPKKFFKSRNSAPPEVIAQMIQQLPRMPISPSREVGVLGTPGYLTTPVRREPIKIKLPKSNSAERKKKTPKKSMKPIKTPKDLEHGDVLETTAPTPALKLTPEPKHKKKKDEKKLKPEAAPSRIIPRARKAVNYCEDDEEERLPTPIKDIVVPKSQFTNLKVDDVEMPESEVEETATPLALRADFPPPAAPPLSTVLVMSPVASVIVTPKTPEYPPIVLRISKGTSRLVSTDSEEQANNASASPQTYDNSELTKSRHASTEEVPVTSILHPITPKIIVKPPKPPSPTAPLLQSNNEDNDDEPPEINYSTVKISPDKPPKERLKLIIKTDVIRNAIAAAAAAAAAKAAAAAEKAALSESAAAASGGVENEQRPEREKKQKSKKHKHPKHPAIEQLMPATVAVVEFKTPSPHLALGNSGEQQQHQRPVISPPALSERDFDSQSSVLGSISSKGNSTPQLHAQTAQEESCVIHSRGSSVITSDLETSQHSSLVAPPSDIESRLESMMMDGGEVCQRGVTNLVVADEEPLQEDDILAVLRGDESQTATIKENGILEKHDNERKMNKDVVIGEDTATKRRVTRGRGKGATKTNYTDEEADEKRPPSPSLKAPTAAKTRGRKPISFSPQQAEEAPVKRSTRSGAKKADETTMEIEEVTNSKAKIVVSVKATATKQTEDIKIESKHTQQLPTQAATRRGRPQRNASNNNNNNNNLSTSNNNNNINKIAANLSARAGAAEGAKVVIITPTITATATTTTSPIQTSARSYGRKRKNQQVMQVLQPSAADIEEHQQPTPAKVANINLDVSSSVEETTIQTPPPSSSVQHLQQNSESAQTFDQHDANSDSNSLTRPGSTTPASPPRRDYKIKDKFKRTLTLDNQVNCNAVIAAPPPGNVGTHGEEEPHRGAVKLVISKKKGSIFKSRALVPADQFEQAGTTTKRHLYKHRWDADANGGSSGSGNGTASDANAKLANDTPATANTRNAADSIFDDFSEDLSGGGDSPSLDHSPALGKLTRVIKPNPQSTGSPYDSCEAGDTPMALTGGSGGSDTITSIKIDRKAKEYYTVVRNVKTAHQIQEIGEYQEMDDDVEYFLDALQPHNPTPTRCLSALQLATKCMTAAFRMHVRAHGVVTKFFKALADANTDLSLGLCTSVIMFILSQEGLNMDLDRDSLELMMNLLEAEEGVAAPADRATYDRNWHKVRSLCEEIKVQGKATHLNVDAITVGTLAMETLLSLTSKRAGDWFKEELRALGGLEHIIKTISACCKPVFNCGGDETGGISWTPALLDNLQTVARCMRVLENVTQMNEENQRYMLTYANGAAVESICTLYRLCNRELMQHATTGESSTALVLRELLIPVMKVLINLTHTFNAATTESRSNGAELLGQRADVLQTSLNLLLQATNYIPDRSIFELSILVLLLLINLTMYAKANRKLIMNADAPLEFGTKNDEGDRTPAVQAIMSYFYKCEELARLVEKNTDAILDNTDKNKKKQEEVDETVNNLLQKAGHHMEHTLKGSYAGLLIGHLISDSPEYETIVRKHLRDNGFKEVVSVLEKYHTFMNLTASSEASVVAHIKSTKQLIDYFKRRDNESNQATTSESGMPLNLETHHADDAGVASSSTHRQVYKTYSQR